MRKFAGTLLAILVLAITAKAEELRPWRNPPATTSAFTITSPPHDPISEAFGACGNPCLIHYNPGGDIDLFHKAIEYAKETKRRIRIMGECYSACILFADKVRPQVCLEEDAKFFFHTWYDWKRLEPSPLLSFFIPDYGGIRGAEYRVFYEPEHSFDLTVWLEANGPVPIDGWLEMSHEDALKFWPACPPR